MRLHFDIETEALPIEQIAHLQPEFRAPSNYKKVEAIADYVNEQRASWLESCALRAETCRILAIGMFRNDEFWIAQDGRSDEERHLLEHTWGMIADSLQRGVEVVGFNIFGFDLPVMMRRSAILSVPVPKCIRTRYRGRSYWHEDLRDLMEEWQCGNRDHRISLDNMTKALGVGAKTGSGKDFAALWHANRAEAVAYLRNDCEFLAKCAERML